MTPHQFDIFKKIRIILGGLHQEWESAIKHGADEGYGKNSEGYIEVRYPSWHQCDELEDYVFPRAYGISIYSYLFGPRRMHDFYGETCFEEALSAALEWRAKYRKLLEEDQ